MNVDKPSYPASDLDTPKNISATLGTFWERFFGEQAQLRAYIDATRFVVKENFNQLTAAVAGLSRHDIPVFSNRVLVPLVLRQSQINTYATNVNRFDRVPALFDDGMLSFNTKRDIDEYAFPAPKDLVSVNQILDAAYSPRHAWLRNIDFFVDRQRGAIIFAENPFESGAKTTTIDGDVCLYLWGLAAAYDKNYIFNQFGYVAGIDLPSSVGYKKLVNAVLDGIVSGGGAAKTVDEAFAAICDIPLVKTEEERVEHIFVDGHGLCIVTDKEVYRYSERNTPLVVPGQKVFGGQSLVDGLLITEFVPANRFEPDAENNTRCRALETYLATQELEFFETQEAELVLLNEGARSVRRKDLYALAVGRGFLPQCYYGDLVFENKDVPLIVDEHHPSGYTYASFELNGHPADVRKFFDEIHARGITLRKPCETDCCVGPAFRAIDLAPQIVSLSAGGTTAHWSALQKKLPPRSIEPMGWLYFAAMYDDADPNDAHKVSGRATPGAVVELVSAYDVNKKKEIAVNRSGIADVCGYFKIDVRHALPDGAYVLKFNQTFQPGLPTTLARMLDKRRYGESEPRAAHLPETINPLRFLLTNVLRNNVFIARIRLAGLGQNQLGLYNIKHLRQILPPQTALITVFELNPTEDKITAQQQVAEKIEFFKGIDAISEAVGDENVLDLGAKLFVVSGTCH